MATSLAFLALSFLVISIAGTEIDADEVSGHVSSLFLFIFYFLQASAVIIMGPIGLAFVTKWAPSRLIGQLVGLWFFTTGMGSFIGGYAASAFADVLSPSQLFGLFFLANAIMSLGLFVMNSFIVSLLGD